MGVLQCVLGCRTLRRTDQVRLGSNSLRLPGGTPIFTVSRRQFMKNAGWIDSRTQSVTLQLDYPISFTMKYAVEESAENARSFPKNVMSDTGQRGRLLHNEQFTPFYGSVAFENAPNLHAGLCGAKSGRIGGSGARCFAASPCGLPGVSSE